MDLEEQIRIIGQIKSKLSMKSARLVGLMISGSDLYGFSSEDSDVDLRGIFIYDSNAFLGLHRPKETLEFEIENYDIVLHEIAKVIKLAMNGNCNILEHIFSPQIYTSPVFLGLKPLIVLNKEGIYNSYKGLATHNYKKFISTGRKKTVKKYLYVFRGLMAGIYALRMGKLEPNLEVLNKHFKSPHVRTLIQLKKKGKENDDLPASIADTGVIELTIEKLFKKIDLAYMKSFIEMPSQDDWDEVERFLIKERKRYLDQVWT